MLERNKTDVNLGKEIEELLIKNNVNTPTNISNRTEKDKIEDVEHHFRAVCTILGLDLDDDSLKDTPMRLAKMYVKELTWGLDPANFPKCTAVENKFSYDEFVIERGIKVMSLCEHHFVTIAGSAVVAYKPCNKVIGLSKLNRIVEYFSRRPQVQERLTEQIWHALSHVLETDDIAVIIEADHFCVKARGVEDHGSNTVTSKLGGVFKNPNARTELLSLMKK